MGRHATWPTAVFGALLLTSLAVTAVCSRGGTLNTQFDAVSVVDGRILEGGVSLSGTLEARDEDVQYLAKSLFTEAPLAQWVDVPTRGLVLELPIVDGIPSGEAVLYADYNAPEVKQLLAAGGYAVTAAQWISPRVKIATASFIGGKLHGPVVVWKPGVASGQSHKIVEASFDNNRPHGAVIVSYDDVDQVRTSRVFHEGQPIGAAREFYRTGELRQDTIYVEGKRHGNVTAYYRDGATRSRESYLDGVLQHHEAWFPDGTRQSEATFEDGKPMGSQQWYSNGALARTVSDDDVTQQYPAHGLVTEYYNDGTLRRTQTFVNGVADGQFRVYYSTARLWEEGSYRDGQRDGKHRKWWKNGTLALDSRWVAGALEGEFSRWYAHGGLWERSTYLGGKLSGRYQKWWHNGAVANDHTYNARGIDGEYRTYYDSGAPWAVGEFSNGRTIGTMRRWFPDGRLGFEQGHANRRPHGTLRRWYADGSPRLEATYVKGKLHGEFKNWLEDGSVYESATYENGVLKRSTLNPVPPEPELARADAAPTESAAP